MPARGRAAKSHSFASDIFIFFKIALGCGGLFLRELFGGLAEAAFATLVVDDGAVEFFAAEVGPERVAEVEFRVGRLPEQVVAESLLATGADEQVGVGHEGGGELLAYNVLGDVLEA